MRKKVFCWLPTKIHTVKFWRNGFKWLSFAWLDEDGLYYETEEVLTIDVCWLQKCMIEQHNLAGLKAEWGK